MSDAERIRSLESRLAHMSKLHELAERAMRTAYEAQDQFKQLALRYFDEREPLERLADAARAFVLAQDAQIADDFATSSYADLKRVVDSVTEGKR
jgi:hypothetical protein